MTITSTPRIAIELTDRELTLVRNALEIMRSDFGHEQGDLLREIRELLEKLPTPPTRA